MAHDIMPFITGSGGPRVRFAPLNASESFREGALVFVNSDGELAEFPADDTQALISDISGTGILGGIAAMDGDTTRTDGFARSTGDLISYYPWNDGTLFITKNFFTAGDPDTLLIPSGTVVGEDWQITNQNASDIWGVENTAGVQGTDVRAIVHSVLNSRRQPIAASDTTTGVWVVFEIQAGTEAA